MTIEISKLVETVEGNDVYRRRHQKSDGRQVLLYGYEPPTQQAVSNELMSEPSHSELRWHPFRKEWAIYAAGRQNRTFKPTTANDPLAPSSENGAPTEIPFTDFELAVFDNRFPSLAPQETTTSATSIPNVIQSAGVGACEVVVYTPDSTGSLSTLTDARRQLLVHAWNDRYIDLFDAGCEFVLPFENRGDEVGVTLHHPHGQIYGFHFTPMIQQNAAAAFSGGFSLEHAINDWREDYEITSRGGISAFAPPFARFPYEVWLAPTVRRRGPWEFSIAEIEAFASLLGDITRRYDSFFGRACPYMLSLHAAPKTACSQFHFTAQFYPLLRSAQKVKYLASVEQATNVFTVDILPEETAKKLKPL